MTEQQTLLAQYTTHGSEEAFGELVTRFVSLVYSTAVRLVDGDTHRAEDVVQTVFADLARRAKTLSPKVMLGGWLHRRTCHVAATLMRSERRRQNRERQAAEMHALEEQQASEYEYIAPILPAQRQYERPRQKPNSYQLKLTTILLLQTLALAAAPAQEAAFYRIASTNETRIIACDPPNGLLTWTSSWPNACCQVERAGRLGGPWSSDFPHTVVANAGGGGGGPRPAGSGRAARFVQLRGGPGAHHQLDPDRNEQLPD